MSEPNLSSFIWSVADLLRGDYKQSEYGKVILPFTVLRRLDCVLEATKPAVLAEKKLREKAGLNPEPFLLKKSGQLFFNTSPLDLKKLMGDQDHIGENLRAYVQGFSPAVRDIFEHFEFHTQIDKLSKAGLLYLVTEKFANIDLHPKVVKSPQMGLIFEELIRKFAELSNETAGEHFTTREVIRLMVPESYAICKADMLIKGQDIANIIFGNTLSADGLPGKHRPVLGTKGKGKSKPVADANLRDTENGPLTDDIEAYFQREVLPHAPDAWIDHEKTKVGYELPFNRHCYVFKPPRKLEDIDRDLKGVTDRILSMISGLSQ